MGEPRKSSLYRLRPMGVDELEVIAHWFEHLADLSVFDRKMPVPLSKSSLCERWKDSLNGGEPSKNFWFKIDDENEEIVGILGVDSVDYVHGDGVFAIYLAEHVRRKGLGVRATAMLIDIAFGQLRLNRITSYFRADNDATRSLIGSLGFTIEGTQREAWFAGGKYHDVISIGLLASEWKNVRAELSNKLEGGPSIMLGRIPWETPNWPEPV